MTAHDARAIALVVRNAVGTALWLSLALATYCVRTLAALPDRTVQGGLDLWSDLLAATTWRGRLLGLALLPLVTTLPAWAGPSTLSVMISALWFAYTGLAWTLAAGGAGRFSLGHSLFVGLGAYAAGGLAVHSGLGPGPALLAAVPAAAAAGALIGAIGCRRDLGAAHFALLTLACVELGRLAAGHLEWCGGLGGLVLPAAGASPALFYYIALAMTAGALGLCHLLAHSAMGHRWRAARDDATAAAAAGVDVRLAGLSALAWSAALTAPAGVFQAYYAGALAPDQLFSATRSAELLLGPLVGGVGSLFGPVLGALVVSPLGDALSDLSIRAGRDLTALRPLCAGLVLAAIALWAPGGLWPWLARKLRLTVPPEDGGPT